MPGRSSAEILFCEPRKRSPGLGVDPFLRTQDPTSIRQSLIGFNHRLNTVNAIESLAAFIPQVSRINQFLGAGCAPTASILRTAERTGARHPSTTSPAGLAGC